MSHRKGNRVAIVEPIAYANEAANFKFTAQIIAAFAFKEGTRHQAGFEVPIRVERLLAVDADPKEHIPIEMHAGITCPARDPAAALKKWVMLIFQRQKSLVVGTAGRKIRISQSNQDALSRCGNSESDVKSGEERGEGLGCHGSLPVSEYIRLVQASYGLQRTRRSHFCRSVVSADGVAACASRMSRLEGPDTWHQETGHGFQNGNRGAAECR